MYFLTLLREENGEVTPKPGGNQGQFIGFLFLSGLELQAERCSSAANLFPI